MKKYDGIVVPDVAKGDERYNPGYDNIKHDTSSVPGEDHYSFDDPSSYTLVEKGSSARDDCPLIIVTYYPVAPANPCYFNYKNITKKYTAFLWIGDVKTNGGSDLENFSEWCFVDFGDAFGGPLNDNIGFTYTTLTANGDDKPTINIRFYCGVNGYQSYTGSFKFYFGLIPYGSNPQDYKIPTWFSNNFYNLISAGIGFRPVHYLGKYQNIISNTSSDSLVYGLASKIYDNSYVSFWVDNNTNNFNYFHVDFTSNNSNNPLPVSWSQDSPIELNDSDASNRFGSIDGLEKFNVRIKVFFDHS